METLSIRIGKKHIFWFLASLLLCGGLIRILAAYNEVHYFDLPYYFKWSEEVVDNGIFSAYHNLLGIGNNELDYPPLFLFPLYITGLLLKIPVLSEFAPYSMVVIKMWQILFDLAAVVLLYYVLKGQNKLLALGAAAIWAVNPAIIFNSSYWGQTDSMMIFFLLLAFFTLESKRPLLATFFYALACLTKFQCAYFFPVFLLFLLYEHHWKTVLKAAGVGFGTGIAVFFPFMLYSGPMLPFQVYFGGLGKWPYANMYAFNFFGALGLNYVDDSQKFLPFMSYGILGNLMTLFAVVLIFVLMLTAKKKCPYLLSFLLMNTIFMFASRMHDRYQIPVIIFILVAAFRHKSVKLFVGFLLTNTMVLCNQFFPFEYILSRNDPPPWGINMEALVVAFSWINLLVYFITLAISLSVLYDKKFTELKLFRIFFQKTHKEAPHAENTAEAV